MSQITVEAKIENLEQINDFISEALAQTNCNAKTETQILMATEEIFVNVANYAYAPKLGEVTIKLNLINGSNILSLEFTDEGVEYNPLEAKEPDITLPPEEREIGGLGIFMVKKLVDEMKYERRGGKNVLTIKKSF